ncbi:MAG: MarR family transcriptional regulator [Chloroflexota bacterium]
MAARDMEAADAPAALTGSMAILLRQAARRAADNLSQALAPLGLHERHFGILLALADDGPSTQNGLGQRLGIDRTTMVAAIDHLERLSYVVRKPHPTDRRANRIELTGRGRGRLVRATGAASAAEAVLLAHLSVAETDLLKALLARVVQPGRAAIPEREVGPDDRPAGAASPPANKPADMPSDGAPVDAPSTAPGQDPPDAERPEAQSADGPVTVTSAPAEDASVDKDDPPA